MKLTKCATMNGPEVMPRRRSLRLDQYSLAQNSNGRVFFILASLLGGALAPTIVQGVPLTGVALLSTPAADRFDRNNTFGWRFTPTIDIDVSSLGYFDVESLPGGSGTGLTQSHDVGIFQPDTTLVSSVTVPVGTTAPLLNNYRYVELAPPVRLSAGTTYTIGAFYLSTSLDAMPGASNFAFPAEIIYANAPAPTPQQPLSGTSVYIVNVHGNPPSGLSCPQLPLTNLLPIFAANFQFTPACPLSGDVNNDSVIDGRDIQAYVECTLSGATPQGNCACAGLPLDQFVALLMS